jgi:hypothetical protein
LLRALDIAFERKSDAPPATPQIEQKRWADALLAMGRFFSIIDPALGDRFFVLSDEFIDKSVGRDPFTLRSRKKNSSPPTRTEAARANVVFAVNVFIAIDALSPEKAAKKVLKDFPGIKNLAGPKSHRPDYDWHKTVLEWRRTLSAPSRKKNALAAELSEAGDDLIAHFIRTGRQVELRREALKLLRHAERVGLKYCS